MGAAEAVAAAIAVAAPTEAKVTVLLEMWGVGDPAKFAKARGS